MGQTLNLKEEPDRQFLTDLETSLHSWSAGGIANGIAKELTEALVEQLATAGYVKAEEEVRQSAPKASGASTSASSAPGSTRLFGSTPVPAAPPVPVDPEPEEEEITPTAPPPVTPTPATPAPGPTVRAPTATPPSVGALPLGFVMTLQQTDVGVGQTTAGAQRRSPEIFIPKQVVLPVQNRHVQVCNPDFWNWPSAFVADPGWTGPLDNGIGKRDRQMQVYFESNVIDAVMWYNPNKRDFRIRAEALRSAGHINDLIRIERNAPGAPVPYTVYIIEPSDPDFAQYRAVCLYNPTNSPKWWGYYYY
jgi:hypothetical protein